MAAGTSSSQEILGRRLDELLKEVDPHFKLEKDAEGLVLGMAQIFLGLPLGFRWFPFLKFLVFS